MRPNIVISSTICPFANAFSVRKPATLTMFTHVWVISVDLCFKWTTNFFNSIVALLHIPLQLVYGDIWLRFSKQCNLSWGRESVTTNSFTSVIFANSLIKHLLRGISWSESKVSSVSFHLLWHSPYLSMPPPSYYLTTVLPFLLLMELLLLLMEKLWKCWHLWNVPQAFSN